MIGADALCDTLLAGGIDTCFANPGTSEMHFVAALDRKPEMRCVLALFEGVATGAADGYARMLDKPAATLLHLGPGLANGLANLHNARRAHSPLVNIVGDHATHHLIHDAPLTSDIESLARPMSHWVRTTRHANEVARDAAEAVVAARSGAGAVATLILPADAAWGVCTAPPQTPAAPSALTPLPQDRLEHACRILREGGPDVVIMLGATYLRAQAREAAARICQGTGARLLAQQSNARLERGAGRVPITRTPYPVDQAMALLAGAKHLLLFGARPPVGFFAYPGLPGSAVPEGCVVHDIGGLTNDAAQSLRQIVHELGLSEQAPIPRQELDRPDLPTGILDADAVLRTVAALMPEHAILCDETISSGRNLLSITAGAPPHDVLPLNGGAIGIGLPLATGASIACPSRKVICLQADGSAMYTVQALWTQAREQLDVVTIIFANRSYALLHQELRKVGAGKAGRNARRMLDINTPDLQWPRIADGLGVEAATVTTTHQLGQVLTTALSRRGPFLIEARLG